MGCCCSSASSTWWWPLSPGKLHIFLLKGTVQRDFLHLVFLSIESPLDHSDQRVKIFTIMVSSADIFKFKVRKKEEEKIGVDFPGILTLQGIRPRGDFKNVNNSTKIENILNPLVSGRWVINDEKNSRSKISLDCPFKFKALIYLIYKELTHWTSYCKSAHKTLYHCIRQAEDTRVTVALKRLGTGLAGQRVQLGTRHTRVARWPASSWASTCSGTLSTNAGRWGS